HLRLWPECRLPRHLAPLFSGQQDACGYLLVIVARFPDAPSLAQLMRESGFPHVEFSYFDLGIVALHIATKPSGN
ncbi:MAG: class I SAM-dependent methyltransferase, partial [Acidobacteriota bacterium]